MFGLEILDIVIGLTFVYLLLALMATAVNEYLAALLNKRGEELAKGIARLLDDVDGKEALRRAFSGVNPKAEQSGQTLTEQFYKHPLVRPLATPRGWMGRALGMKDTRLPSYIPARTFALAMLDILGHNSIINPTSAAHPSEPDKPAVPTPATTPERANLIKVLKLLRHESSLDVSEHLGGLKGLLEHASMPDEMKVQLVGTVANAQTALQKLHASTEVWFNNSMDRVSGAYKRHTQAFLVLIGMVLASMLNADTIQMWKQLAGNDALRTAMAQRAARLVPALDSLVHAEAAQSAPQAGAGPTGATADLPKMGPAANPANPVVTPVDTARTSDAAPGSTTLALGDLSVPGTTGTGNTPAAGATAGKSATVPDSLARARQKYEAVRMQLDSMELKLGWTWEEAVRVGIATEREPDTKKAQPDPMTVQSDTVPAKSYRLAFHPLRWAFPAKLLGLLMTALAISMGAPFWFDMLNKVISIRGAGRSPAEQPKSPEGPAKRAAEQPSK